MRILIADDDRDCLRSVELMLVSKGFNVELTDSGDEAVELARLYEWDAIVLGSHGGPDGHYDVQQLRKAKVKTPILMLSPDIGPQYVAGALNVGADDYMTKPSAPVELVARIHALVRRSRGHAQSVLTAGPLVLNLDSRLVEVHGEPVYLTGKEFHMLEMLMLRKGKVQSKEQIMTAMYGGTDEPEIKIIDVFVCKLRRKIGIPDLIETVWGRGYLIRGEVAAPDLGEVAALVNEPPVHVSKMTALEYDALRTKRIKSPSIVPAA